MVDHERGAGGPTPDTARFAPIGNSYFPSSILICSRSISYCTHHDERYLYRD